MIPNVPRLVTIELTATPRSLEPIADEPLCTDELLSLVDELADAGVTAVRFVTDERGANDRGLRAIEHARRRRLMPIVALTGSVEDPLVGTIAEAGAVVIAVPLHSHEAATHDAIECAFGGWSRSVRMAGIVRDHKCALEIDTRVTPVNAPPFLPLMETVIALQAAQWRLTFDVLAASGTFATAATTGILHAAAENRVPIIVHRLPQLRTGLASVLSGFHPSALRSLTVIDAGDEMWISSSGHVSFGTPAGGRVGNIRRQAIEAFDRPHPKAVPVVELGAQLAVA
ncbi:MAG: hypothetical protein ABI718_03405 [Acidobacteriota bacterium]